MSESEVFLQPLSVADAIRDAYLHRNNFRYVAGGTDVLVNKQQGNENSGCLIDLTGIAELTGISEIDGYLRIGALTKLDELCRNALIRERFPALVSAAEEAASPVLRKTATIGGNVLCENRCTFYNQSEWWREAAGYCLKCDGDICIATGGRKACFSKFVSDTAPVLISLDGQLELYDLDGPRTCRIESIYTGDGVAPRNLQPTAIVKAILLPAEHKYRVVFKKLRSRNAVDFTSLTTAVSLNSKGGIRVVVGGVDPKPIVIEGSLRDSIDHFVATALKKSRVVDNDYYPRSYRREMMKIFLEDSLRGLIK